MWFWVLHGVDDMNQDELKLVGYGRVSSAEQVKGYSLDAQDTQIRVWGSQNDAEIFKMFIEKGKSGRSDQRPEFLKMIDFVCKSSYVDGVVVHKSDRFARNLLDYLTYRAELEQHGKRLFSVTEPFLNDDSPESRMVAAIIASVAQYVAENIGKESQKGRHQKALSGEWHGSRVPLGYTRDENKQIIIDDKYAEMIKHSYKAFLTKKYTLTSWTKEAKRLGYTNQKGNFFHRATWWKMFRSIFYTGHYVYKDEVYQGSHPAIIDIEDYEAMQTILDDRNTGGSKNRHFWLLKGLLWSEPLDLKMHGSIAKRKYGYYRAGSGDERHEVSANEVEGRVSKLLESIKGVSPHASENLKLMMIVSTEAGHLGYLWASLIDDEQRHVFLCLVFKKVYINRGGAIERFVLGDGFESL